MKKKFVKSLAALCSLTFILGLAACGGGSNPTPAPTAGGSTPAPDDGKVYEIRLASTQADGNDIDLTLDDFAARCLEKSNGRLKITVYTGNILGDELSTTEMCQQGQLEMTLTSAGVVENFIPSWSTPSVPGLINTYDELEKAINGKWGEKLAEDTAAQGMVMLGCTCTGVMKIGSVKKPVASIEDMKGLNIRCIESKAWSIILSAYGANPVPMAFSEVPSSLQLGAIDGCFLAPGVFVSTGIADIMDYFTNDWAMGLGVCPVFVNKAYFDSLPADLQQIIYEAFDEAEANGFNRNRENEEKNLKVMQDHGVELATSTPEQLEEVNRINKEIVWPQLIKEGVTTQEGIDLVLESLK